MTVKRSISLSDQKEIHIYDDIFHHQEMQDFFAHAEQGEYIRTNLDLVYFNNQNVDLKWSRLLSPNKDKWFLKLVSIYKKEIEELQKPFSVERSYINFSTMDTVDLIHCDCLSDNNNQFTLLHYLNWHWDVNWHGETMFYDDQAKESVASVSIKPGRVIIFNGNIPHSAIAPSRIASYPRYTLAMKLHF